MPQDPKTPPKEPVTPPQASEYSTMVTTTLARKAEVDKKVEEQKPTLLRDPFADITKSGNKSADTTADDNTVAQALFGAGYTIHDDKKIKTGPALRGEIINGFSKKAASDKQTIVPQTTAKVESVHFEVARSAEHVGGNNYEIRYFKATMMKDKKTVGEFLFSGHKDSFGRLTEMTYSRDGQTSVIKFNNGLPTSQEIASKGDKTFFKLDGAKGPTSIEFKGKVEKESAEATYTLEAGKIKGATYTFKIKDPADGKKTLTGEVKVDAKGTQVVTIRDGKTVVEEVTIPAAGKDSEKKEQEKSDEKGKGQTAQLGNSALRDDLAGMLLDLNLGTESSANYNNTGLSGSGKSKGPGKTA